MQSQNCLQYTVKIHENKNVFFDANLGLWLGIMVSNWVTVGVGFKMKLYDFVAVPASDHPAVLPQGQDEKREPALKPAVAC